MRTENKVVLISATIVGVAAACGGRSGTEIFGRDDLVTDGGGNTSGGSSGSGGSGGGIVEAGEAGGSGGGSSEAGPAGAGGTTSDADVPDVSVDAPATVDAASDAKDFFDALPPLPDGGPVGDCVACLQGQCGDVINACYNDPTCVSGIQCMVTQCVTGGGGGGGGAGGGGGGIDFQCVLGCFNNDMASTMRAINAFICATQTCGPDCGLGAGGGGGAGGAPMTGMPFPKGLFGSQAAHPVRADLYVGPTRVPRPEEVASAYPWFAELLAGRMPDPPPPSVRRKRR